MEITVLDYEEFFKCPHGYIMFDLLTKTYYCTECGAETSDYWVWMFIKGQLE